MAVYIKRSNTYDGRYLELRITQTNNPNNNTSTLSWTLTSTGGNSNYYSIQPTTIKINGKQVYNKAYTDWTSYAFPAAKGSTSGTLVVEHNSDGSLVVPVYFYTGVYSTSAAKDYGGSFVLGANPRGATITSAYSFDDEQTDITIYYQNPGGVNVNSLQACIASEDGKTIYISYRDIDKMGTIYTFKLTEEEQISLRKRVKSGVTLPIRYYIRTKVGEDTTLYSSIKRTYSLINYQMTLAPYCEDTNETTKALTGAPTTKLIKGYSNILCSSGAQAMKEATVAQEWITNGETKVNTGSYTFNGAKSGKFQFDAVDSRGINAAAKVVNFTVIDYIAPSCNQEIELEMSGETAAKATVTISGNYFNGSFGAASNSLTLQMRYSADGATLGSWTTVTATPTYSGNTYKVVVNISGLSYDSSYTFQCRATDKVTKATTAQYTTRLTPVFDWSKEDFAFNVPVSINGNPVKDFVVDYGTASMGSNGTWYWYKWASGKAECYGLRNYGNMAITTAWGSLFMSSTFTQSLPSGLFNAAPDYISITTEYGGFTIGSTATAPSATNTGSFRVVRGTSENGSQVKLRFNVIGRWK